MFSNYRCLCRQQIRLAFQVSLGEKTIFTEQASSGAFHPWGSEAFGVFLVNGEFVSSNFWGPLHCLLWRERYLPTFVEPDVYICTRTHARTCTHAFWSRRADSVVQLISPGLQAVQIAIILYYHLVFTLTWRERDKPHSSKVSGCQTLWRLLLRLEMALLKGCS